MPNTKPVRADWLPYLDGLRGIAAGWVLLSHILILTGWPLPILSWGDLGVDLFMMLSGFLMAFHAIERADRDPWNQWGTWAKFWTRRFFRIAPVFYLLLMVAISFGDVFGAARLAIGTAYPATATDVLRYGDIGPINVLLHLSFLFGLVPAYSFRTPLPDWSIGLEMQFYVFLPAILLFARRIGWALSTVALIALCLALRLALPDYFAAFPMPSMLALKLDMFLLGILLAAARQRGVLQALALVALALALPLVDLATGSSPLLWVLVRMSMAAGLTLLVFAHRIQFKPLSLLCDLLGGRVGRMAGDLSYSVYLLHLLIVIPTIGAFARDPAWLASSPLYRLLTVVPIAVPIALIGAWLLHRFVEQPGIKLGKALIALSDRPRPPQQGQIGPTGLA